MADSTGTTSQYSPVVLTIAGSDSCAGAGLQADLKTCSALGVYACTAVTAITAQNTLGVQQSWPVSAEQLKAQLESIDNDIAIAAIKVGMLGNVSLVRVLVDWLRARQREGRECPIVVDPVLVSSSGRRLLCEEGQQLLQKELLPLSTLLTPNLPELAALLNDVEAKTDTEIHDQAEALHQRGAGAILVKGGHGEAMNAEGVAVCVDWLLSQRDDPETRQPVNVFERFSSERIDTQNNHGTGCTLASAIAAYLAYGVPLGDAVAEAKQFISGALFHADQLAVGGRDLKPVDNAKSETHEKSERGVKRGPVHHFYRQWPSDAEANQEAE